MAKDKSSRDEGQQSFHSFLMALKGKTVTIYRGGPESKTGKLLDVQEDYITLYAQENNQNQNQAQNQNQTVEQLQNEENKKQNKIVYYQVQHVKSIIEDTKSNSIQVMDAGDEEIGCLEADNFTGVLAQMMDENIQINQGGPESKQGKLVGLSGDFLVLFTDDDGIVYINTHHVKSVSKNIKNNQNELLEEAVVIPKWVKAEYFHDVFRCFSHQWVSINRGGPEAMEGVLVENAGGHYTLVNNQEVMRIHPYHIKSINCGPKGSLKQNKQENKQENAQEESVENKSEENSSSEESSSSSSSSSSEHKRSSRSKSTGRKRRRHSSRENVTKTIDYHWKG